MRPKVADARLRVRVALRGWPGRPGSGVRGRSGEDHLEIAESARADVAGRYWLERDHRLYPKARFDDALDLEPEDDDGRPA